MSSIPSNRSAWEGRDEEEGERGDGGGGKDVHQVGGHHWYSTKMHLFVGNYFLIPFGKSSFVWAILPSTIFTMSVTPRTATSLLSARLLIVDQEKSQFFRPLSTSFITLFKGSGQKKKLWKSGQADHLGWPPPKRSGKCEKKLISAFDFGLWLTMI